MKKLNELLADVRVRSVCGDMDKEVLHVHFDSRKVESGDLFVAQRGVNVDGHAFISKAIGAGCCAVVCEELPQEMWLKIHRRLWETLLPIITGVLL